MNYRRTTPVESEPHCPACNNKLSQFSETETPIGMALSQIESIGTALCEACGQAWMYAQVPATADTDEIRTKLDQTAELTCSDLLGANDAFPVAHASGSTRMRSMSTIRGALGLSLATYLHRKTRGTSRSRLVFDTFEFVEA